jgi:mRNA interferase MazF
MVANLTPTKGTEQSGHRPVVIISGDMLNTNLPLVIACPLTTKIKGYKGDVILNPSNTNGLEVQSEILNFHIRSITKERLSKKVGVITKKELEEVKETVDDLLRF